MKSFFRNVLLVALMMTLGAVADKPNLPFRLLSQPVRGSTAAVEVVFDRAATDVTITIRATGTATMQPVTRRFPRIASGQTVKFSAIETTPGTFGGVAVHLDASFGAGARTQVRTLTLTQAPLAPSSVRAKKREPGEGSPHVIIVPSKTTVTR